MANAKELREQQARILTEARAKFDEIKDSTPAERAAEIEREFDAMMADHDKIGERLQRMERAETAQRALEQIDLRTAAPVEARQSRNIEIDARPEYREVFRNFLVHGAADLSAEERAILREHRAQSVGTDSAGGFTVPTEFVAELVVSMAAYSPMFDQNVTRQLVTASGAPIEMPTLNDLSNTAVLLAENTAAAEDDTTFGQVTLSAYKYTSGLIKVSAELMQDSAINVEAEIRRLMAVRFGRGVGAALTTGTGSSQPSGIVTGASAGVTGAASAITFDNLIDLQHSVDPAYRVSPNAAFMFNDATLQALRKLKDNDGNYIWQAANVQTGAGPTLLGQRYVVNQAMANIGASNVSVLFGDMDKYIVRRARDIDIKRLDERYAEADQIAFVGFVRVDGRMLDTAAIKKLTHAAS